MWAGCINRRAEMTNKKQVWMVKAVCPAVDSSNRYEHPAHVWHQDFDINRASIMRTAFYFWCEGKVQQ